MKNHSIVLRAAIIVLIILVLLVFVPALISYMNKDGKDDPDSDSFVQTGSSVPQSCTVGDITFSVNGNWVPYDGKEGAFKTASGKEVYLFQGVSPLSDYSPEEFYASLIEYYSQSYEIKFSDKTLETITLADSSEAKAGKIEMTDKEVFYSVDVIIVPQKNIVATFCGQCKSDGTLPTEVREISSTMLVNIGTKDAVSGNSFTVKDGSELILSDENTFIYYQYENDHDGAYVKGSYEVYYGQAAFDKLSGMKEYGLTEEELESVLRSDMKGYVPGGAEGGVSIKDGESYQVCKDTFYLMILHNESGIDETGEYVELGHDMIYFGYYIPELGVFDTTSGTARHVMWTIKAEKGEGNSG